MTSADLLGLLDSADGSLEYAGPEAQLDDCRTLSPVVLASSHPEVMKPSVGLCPGGPPTAPSPCGC